MTDMPPPDGAVISRKVQTSLARRYAAERRFRMLGAGAILLALAFLLLMFVSVAAKGYDAFRQSMVRIDLTLDQATLDPLGDRSPESLKSGAWRGTIRDGFRALAPDIEGRRDRRLFGKLLSSGAPFLLRNRVLVEPQMIGTRQAMWFPLSDDADVFFKGAMTEVRVIPAPDRFGPVDVRLADDGGITLSAARGDFLTLPGLAVPDAGGDGISLSDTMPSYLMEWRGGVVKLRHIAAREATGELLIPFSDAAGPDADGDFRLVILETPQALRRLNDRQIAWLRALQQRGLAELRFNAAFFSAGDSREPEQAGLRGALMGSFLTLLVTLILSFPVGVMAALYLEEFAPKNRWTDLIEVNISNLAAVPSIVFGLLGLAVFLNFFGMPRSAPLVGGLVLALMTMPTIIISSRAALKSVPRSIREAALGLGASRLQATFHHVLPMAMPGMLTGAIIGMAQALGETAPLLMIGMVAFIADAPAGFTDPATVLPVQIYLWADSPERAFVERTAGAILVLLVFLIMMNLAAVLLRRKFERRG